MNAGDLVVRAIAGSSGLWGTGVVRWVDMDGQVHVEWGENLDGWVGIIPVPPDELMVIEPPPLNDADALERWLDS